MIKQLVRMSENDNKELHETLLKVNILLEAFGNAKTQKNHNSSRFSKYIELTFQKDGDLAGVIIRDYILEKSRVVCRCENEGNFHLFYSLFHGASTETLKELSLDKHIYEYRILQSDQEAFRQKDKYSKMYKEQMRVLKQIHTSPEQIQSLLAVVLHLTEIRFTESSIFPGASDIADLEPLVYASELLGVKAEDLIDALISTKMTVSGEKVRKNKSPAEAAIGRDALAKALYERMFQWIVRQVNMNLHPNKLGVTERHHIGILDIAGFETLEVNSFEQLCINTVNERLQNFMNEQIFSAELKAYKDEGIDVDDVVFKNNDELIDFLTKPRNSVLSHLDEHSRLQQGTDMSFVRQLNDNYMNNELFSRSQSNEVEFAIKHFAGKVLYNTKGFIEKNRDLLNDELEECMKRSTDGFISDLFIVQKNATGTISDIRTRTTFHFRKSSRKHGDHTLPKDGVKKQRLGDLRQSINSLNRQGTSIQSDTQTVYKTNDNKTVASHLQASLRQLLGKIRTAEQLFVRCLKPNDHLRPDEFTDHVVLEQIKYNGVSEIARIRRMGFTERTYFVDFVKRYGDVWLTQNKRGCDSRRATMDILTCINTEYQQDYRLGKTKVFMKERLVAWMEKELVAHEAKNLTETPQITISPVLERPACMTSNTESDTSDESKLLDAPTHSVEKEKNSETEATEESVRNSETKKNKPFWDIFQVVSRDKKGRDVDDQRSLKVLKVVTYIILFSIVLFCAVAQKISLITLTTDQKDSAEIEISRYWLAVIAICIPYSLTLISSMFKWLFGNMSAVRWTTLQFCMFMEGVHAGGIALFVFRVLPKLDVVRAVLILNAVGIVPSCLSNICSAAFKRKQKTGHPCENSLNTTAKLVLDILSFLAQMSVVPVIILFEYFPGDNAREIEGFELNTVEVIFTIFMVSFSMWENFVDDRFCGELSYRSGLRNFLVSLKFDLQESRPKIFFFTSLIKIAVIIGAVYGLQLQDNLTEGKDLVQNAWSAFDQLHKQHMAVKSSALILPITTFVGYYAAYTACKLNLQVFSFSVPLFLSTPVAFVLAYVDCFSQYFLGRFSAESRVCDLNENGGSTIVSSYFWERYWWQILLGAAWWLSIYWMGRHIWFPTQGRLAKLERLFTTPFYCSVFFEEQLVLSRRRHNRKVFRDFIGDENTKKKFYYRLSEYDSNEKGNDDGGTYEQRAQDRIPPMIYACATMWHETRHEMVQLLKSLFRLDMEQFLRRNAEVLSGKIDSDYYDYEAHIFFDDAMELNDNEEFVPNQFVKMFVEVVEEAASSVHEQYMEIADPYKVPAPYGGQLIWQMPGGNLLFLHMKDKNKIRHRKRWSQVMYMYYLLGFRLVRQCEEVVVDAIESGNINHLLSWKTELENCGKSQVFQALSEEVVCRADNTFILALDGDVDFKPGAVRLLLDRLKRSEKTAVACGRIHPIGSGPLVWYQKFEYAVGHWFQKATEHVLGCVLCSPGCFSIFRGSALMDDNVMKKYTIQPTEAIHHLMFDQGEDRWLCTLLLQQGYRVDYAAAADAYTYAPESFEEYFNQRRRWTPSTVANIVDLLTDYKNTVAINGNISMLYIIYQCALLASSLIGPATILLMIAGALRLVFGLDTLISYIISLIPAVTYFAVCFFLKPKWQILIAELFTGMYAFVMMIILVGSIESPFHPSVIFIAFITVVFAFAAFLHPKEWFNVVFGLLYFILVPSGYLLLVIYSLVNLNVISWGTREVPKKRTKRELEAENVEEERNKKEKAEKRGLFARLFPSEQLKDILDMFRKMTEGQMEHYEENTINLIASLNENVKRLALKKEKEHAHVNGATSKTQRCKRQRDTSFRQISEENNVNIYTEAEKNEYSCVRRIPGEKGPLKGILRKKQSGVSFEERRKTNVSIDSMVTVISANNEKTETCDIHNSVRHKTKDDATNPTWLSDAGIGQGDVLDMMENERNFWNRFVATYLYPLEKDIQAEKEMTQKLAKLRNNVALGTAMVNLLWMAVNFMFQIQEVTVIELRYTVPTKDDYLADEPPTNVYVFKIEVLGILFLLFFVFILLIQTCGMVIHRWGTFQHLISITQLWNPFLSKSLKRDLDKKGNRITTQEALEVCKKILAEPIPEYGSDEEEAEEKCKEEFKEQLKNIQTIGIRHTIGKSMNMGTSLRTSTLRGSARFDLNVGGETANKLRHSIGRSFKRILGNTYRETENDTAPEEKEEFQKMHRTYQQLYMKNEDPLPDPARSFRNLRGAQSSLWRRIKSENLQRNLPGINESNADFSRSIPIVRETDLDENIITQIPGTGTMGRKLGRRLMLMHVVAKENESVRRQSWDN
ncbi:hypothetical protein ACJMK2_021607 [Sinanodonta woodiana]|uniref:chitin synthase n=1 Tax=Sinanodonta woodiana TaxID=1069815 RepID=A0ABD3TGM3_SINWO